MFVKDVMTPIVVTVSPDDSLLRAANTMAESGHESLVVVKDRIPLGILAIRHIALYRLKNPATMLDNVTVGETMSQKQPGTVEEEDIIEEAAFRLQKYDCDALPVVNHETGRLVGVISSSDVLRAFIHLLGLRARSTRITLQVTDRIGVLADICSVVRNCGISIASLATFQPAGQDLLNVVLRVRTPEASMLVRRLNNAGFKVIHESRVWE